MSDQDVYGLGPLLQRWRSGDAPAGNELLTQLRPYLKARLRAWLGSDLARRLSDSDIVQETLLRIYRGLDGFRGQTVPEFLGWVERIAYHAAVDQQRKVGLPAPANVGMLAALVDPGRSPEDALMQAEHRLRLAHALDLLSEPRREVVQARLFDGWSYAEIAARLGGSEGSLRVLFARAVEQLRQILGSEA